MDINLPAGKYVIAVSGGVDSVALLHILSKQSDVNLIVAHYDHGIRSDSAADRKLVQELAIQYQLPFMYAEGKLGSGASEAVARWARYQFLETVRQENAAAAIITAHHQNDVLETIILNLLRGTNHRGLHSLSSSETMERPLLNVTKASVHAYAIEHQLTWHEDSTNSDQTYLRNYIRASILPRFDHAARQQLLAYSVKAAAITTALDAEIRDYLDDRPDTNVLDRYQFTMLPHAVAREIMAVWLRQQTDVLLSKQLLERVVVAAKTGKNGSKVDINAGHWLLLSPTELQIQRKSNT